MIDYRPLLSITNLIFTDELNQINRKNFDLKKFSLLLLTLN